MQYIQTKIEYTFLTYDPNEFIPIRVDGKLINKRRFALYKAKALLAR